MHYELYIDLLYLVNFMMDILVLSLVYRITKCSTTYIRITLAASLGALLTCLVMAVHIPYIIIRFFLYHVVINSLMIKIGMNIKDSREFIKCMICLYFSSFLMGGILQWMEQYLKISSLFCAVSVVSYWVIRGLWIFVVEISRGRQKWHEVEIFKENNSVVVKALLDTGNSLYDPYTGKPVSVIEKEAIKELLLLQEEYEGVSYGRYIPFHSLGNQGIIRVIKVEKIRVTGTKEYWITNPLLALSDEALSSNRCYQMLLNPDIL